MATPAPVLNETQAVRSALRDVPEVEQVFVDRQGCNLSVLAVIPDFDVDVQNRIFDAELQLTETFPGTRFEFKVVFLQGRQLKEIVSPAGVQLFAR